MENKKLATLVLSAIVAWLVVSASNADFDINDFSFDKSEMKQEFRKGFNGWMKGLTDEEKTQVESMTTEEKTAFFESKKAERDAEREAKQLERKAHEAVIDKLLAWETLTADEEVIRSEIITKRAERKAEQEARQAEMEEIKAIMTKKQAWETLTDDEQAKLDEMKTKWPKWGKWYRWEWRGFEEMDR